MPNDALFSSASAPRAASNETGRNGLQSERNAVLQQATFGQIYEVDDKVLGIADERRNLVLRGSDGAVVEETV